MEIRNQLTLELITNLQSTETIPRLTGLLAYSSDGRSIACASGIAIIIWDIQTGGVAKEIECNTNNISLKWSLDGRTICTINSEDHAIFDVHTYDVSSGTTSSPGTFQSTGDPYLWADDESFWVMRTWQNMYNVTTIDTFKVGSTLIQLRSFTLSSLASGKIGSFSPTTHRISISNGRTFRIFDVQNSESLLYEVGNFFSHCFSSDGSLFAASHNGGVHTWKYASGDYTLWREFRCQGWSNAPLQFSPTPSSILGYSGDILRVWRLHQPPAKFEIRQTYVGLSRSGTRIATALKFKNTVKIIDLLTQTPPQYIDTDVEIDGLVLTGNVLLVAGSQKLTAWLLTEEGLVGGVIGDRRVGRSDSIWNISFPELGYGSWKFQVQHQVGFFKLSGDSVHVYHTGTGEVLHPTRVPQYFVGGWSHLDGALRGRDYLCYHDSIQWDIPPKDRWQNSQTTLREGWVKDAEGKHRLWVPVEWRTDWDPADWCHDVTTQFSILGGRTVLIKF